MITRGTHLDYLGHHLDYLGRHIDYLGQWEVISEHAQLGCCHLRQLCTGKHNFSIKVIDG